MPKFYILIIVTLLSYFNTYANHSSKNELMDSPNYNLRIAIVDLQFIIDNSTAVESIREEIEKISDSITRELSKKENEMLELENELTKKRGTVSEELYEKEVADFYKKVSKSHSDVRQQKLKLEQSHIKVMQEIQNQIAEIIADISKQRNINLVLTSAQILYNEPELDITNNVLEKLNQTLPHVYMDYQNI